MNYPLLIFLGVIPSVIWLIFYLRKDKHPESKIMILKIFFYGMLVALPAILLELGFRAFLEEGVMNWKFNIPPMPLLIINTFIGVALVEEFLKYLVVRGKVLRSSEFDEPVDVIIYMITAAMGFAAAENILILFSSVSPFVISDAISITFYRFLGATFLHALASGSLGFFLALSLRQTKNRGKLLLAGLFFAGLLHGLYNFSIITIEGSLSFIIPLAVLIGLALFLAFSFKKLKKLKSISI